MIHPVGLAQPPTRKPSPAGSVNRAGTGAVRPQKAPMKAIGDAFDAAFAAAIIGAEQRLG